MSARTTSAARLRTAVALLVATLGPGAAPVLCADDVQDKPPSGVYRAEEIAVGEKMTASGIVWWKDRLVVADRGRQRIVAFAPPDRFEVLHRCTNPFGVAVDREGRLLFAEKDAVNRIVRLKDDGTEEVLAEGEAVGSPHFLTVHRSGRILWSGFPDGGTRSLVPGAAPQVHLPRIGHTYGIALAPDESAAFVSSKLPNPDRRTVWRFPIDAQGNVGEGREFFRTFDLQTTGVEGLPPAKDGSDTLVGWVGRLQGLTVDRLGNFYLGGAESHTSGAAVAVVAPDGKRTVAMILGVPGNVTATTFGGPDGRTLYIVGSGNYHLFQVRLPCSGFRPETR
jgi:sugar lactone lactonase YvrE